MPNSSSHTLPPGPRSRRAHPIARSSFATCRPRSAPLRSSLVARWFAFALASSYRGGGGGGPVASSSSRESTETRIAGRPARAGPGRAPRNTNAIRVAPRTTATESGHATAIQAETPSAVASSPQRGGGSRLRPFPSRSTGRTIFSDL